jgi:long-chain acyl-CoA synthetase
VNAARAPYAQVKAWAVLPETPSIEGGELTPTLKVRRRVIEAREAARIEALYRGLGL